MNTAPEPPGHGRCGARTRSGRPCRLPAGHGTDHPGIGRCDHHGGSTPTHEVHARRVLAEEAAAQFGLVIDTTPEEALLGLLASVAGEVEYFRARCAELGQQAMVYGTVQAQRTRQGQVVEDKTIVKSEANIWLVLLAAAEQRLLDVAATIARLGIEKRMVELEEAEAAALARVLEYAIAGLGDAEQQQVRQALPAAIRLVTGCGEEEAG